MPSENKKMGDRGFLRLDELLLNDNTYVRDKEKGETVLLESKNKRDKSPNSRESCLRKLDLNSRNLVNKCTAGIFC